MAKLSRYIIWTGIAAVLFFIILFFFYNTSTLFYILAAIAMLGLLKDSIDFYLMANGKHGLGGHYMEHLPIMIATTGVSAIMLVNTANLDWLAVLIAAIIDSAIDFYQDQKCC